MKTEIIEYGIGKDYLKDWGVNEALREIYQNFIDYGDFKSTVSPVDSEGKIIVSLINDFNPDSLDFLRIGFSDKPANSVGKYGEGIKMALFVLARENYAIGIKTKNYLIEPMFISKSIGEIFALKVKENKEKDFEGFKVFFRLEEEKYNKYKERLVFKKDVIYEVPSYGQIVDKPAGEIYVGKLFVIKVNKLKRAYNFDPNVVALNRDRNMVSSFDINYNASIINDHYAKLTIEDLEHDDFKYVKRLPEDIKQNIVPKRNSANDIDFVHQEKDKDGKVIKETIINHDNIKNNLKRDSLFTKVIKSIKEKIFKMLGVQDLLVEFKNKYSYHLPEEAIAELDYIIENYGSAKGD